MPSPKGASGISWAEDLASLPSGATVVASLQLNVADLSPSGNTLASTEIDASCLKKPAAPKK